ncbi:MAG TPA: cupin domain-containing protein [Candidatus Acidoferrum sp.]
MREFQVMLLAIGMALLPQALLPQERKVEPTWLYRDVAVLPERQIDLSSESCHYTAIFGEGDAESKVPKSVARFGELTVAPHGSCSTLEYPRQEELYFVLGGSGMLHYGEQSHSLAQNDFTYVPPTVRHSVSNPSSQPLRVVVTTVRIPQDTPLLPPGELAVANLVELKEETVGGHPNSVLYKLLIGPRTGTRDRINATYAVADFFLMDFAPGATNTPHHHEAAEEIYLVLDGEGQMAAGGGMDGVEGLHHTKAGDAYYFRPNCTVGFYNQKASSAKAHVLAVRVFVPMPKNPD